MRVLALPGRLKVAPHKVRGRLYKKELSPVRDG